MSNNTTYTVTVTQDKARDRLDRFLAAAVPALSRSRLKGLIESGRVTRDGDAVTEAAAKVKVGEVYGVLAALLFFGAAWHHGHAQGAESNFRIRACPMSGERDILGGDEV